MMSPWVAILVALLSCAVGANGATIQETDALVQFFATFQGERWFVKDGWVLSRANATTDACSWFGVFCNTAGRVQELQLRRNNLKGAADLMNLTQLQSITTVDVSYNGLVGQLPDEIFKLPRISQVQASRNSMTRLPAIFTIGGVSASLAEVYLEMNRFLCPLPTYDDLSPRLRTVWMDQNSTTCVRTRTVTRVRSRTVIPEEPVPSLGGSLDIPALIVETALTVNAETLDLFRVVIAEVLLRNQLVDPPATNTSAQEFVNVSAYSAREVYLAFFDAAPIEFRRDLYSRLKSDHPSIRRLQQKGVTIVNATGPDNTIPADPQVAGQDGSVARGAVIAILVTGIAIVLVLSAVAVFIWCRRKQPLKPVQPMPGAPPQKPTLVSSRSLRIDHSLSRGPSMAMRSRSFNNNATAEL